MAAYCAVTCVEFVENAVHMGRDKCELICLVRSRWPDWSYPAQDNTKRRVLAV